MSESKKWKCSECGYTFEADEVPEKCPSCAQECSFLDATSYTPDDEGGVDTRIG